MTVKRNKYSDTFHLPHPHKNSQFSSYSHSGEAVLRAQRTGLKSLRVVMMPLLSWSRMWCSGPSCRKKAVRGGRAGLGWVAVSTGWKAGARSRSRDYRDIIKRVPKSSDYLNREKYLYSISCSLFLWPFSTARFFTGGWTWGRQVTIMIFRARFRGGSSRTEQVLKRDVYIAVH